MDARVRTPQVIGHEMSGTVAELGEGVEGFPSGDAVVVRPLDARGETPADRGFSHISRKPQVPRDRRARARCRRSWTVPAFTLHALPAGVDLRLGALAEPLAVACHDVRRGEVAAGADGGRDRRRPDRAPDRARRARRGRAGARRRAGRRRVARSRRSSGSTALDPERDDVGGAVADATDGAGAEVVFEVSGSAAGILAATGSRRPARAGRRRRDLSRAEAGGALRPVLEGARAARRARLRAGGLRRRDRAARRGHARRSSG